MKKIKNWFISCVFLFMISMALSSPQKSYGDGITNQILDDLRSKLVDSKGKAYSKLDWQYFSVDTTVTLTSTNWAVIPVNPGGFASGIASSKYLLSRLTVFLEGNSTLKTLSDTVVIYITQSSDSLPTNPKKFWWGPFPITGEDSTVTGGGSKTDTDPTSYQMTLSTPTTANTLMTSRMAAYQYRWKHVINIKYGQASSGELDTLALAAGQKVLFRDITFNPPLCYRNASATDSMVYFQIKPLLTNGTGPDSIDVMTLRLEGFRLDVP